MKIDLDKPARPHTVLNEKHQLIREPGMTVREEAWLRFAANPPKAADDYLAQEYGWKDADVARLQARWACKYADAMIATIEAREGESD